MPWLKTISIRLREIPKRLTAIWHVLTFRNYILSVRVSGGIKTSSSILSSDPFLAMMFIDQMLSMVGELEGYYIDVVPQDKLMPHLMAIEDDNYRDILRTNLDRIYNNKGEDNNV